MRRALLGLLFLVSCSGDDASHARPTRPLPAVPPDGGVGGVAEVTAKDAAPEAPPVAVAPLTEDMARPYFTEGEAADGAARYALEDWKPARAHFAAAAKASTDADERAHLGLLIALCDAELGNWSDAAAGLDDARTALPVLADWIGYQEARALYFAHRTDDALVRAQAVAADSIVGADAALLIGDLLRAQGDDAVTAAHYRDYLARPSAVRRSEARYRLAEALEGSHGDKAEIVALYRQITIDDPLSSWTTKADKRLAKLGGGAALTGAEHIARGQVLFDAMRNPESEAEFDAALADTALTAADRCVAAYAKAQSRFKARDRKGAAPMFDDAVTACAAAGDKDTEIKSAYNGGRSYAFIGAHDEALARYTHAQEVDPANSYADDALLRQAEEYESLGKDAELEAALSSLPDKFPAGDMRAEAMWRLGFRAWRAGDASAAIKWWKKQIEVMPIDDNYWAEGQAQYWLGRAYASKHKEKEAATWWEECVRTYPMNYYAMLSLNRLRESAPKRAKKLIAEIAAEPAGWDATQPAFTFAPRAEYATPAFARALELMRLGLGDPAERELKTIGLTPPNDKNKVTDADQIEKLWAMAFLHDRAGDYPTSIWPTRWHILDYKRQWPVGANRARWQVAFPKAYWDLLAKNATLNKLPVELIIGIVREESGFNPLDESYANAIGLTQMIFPTAERFAKGTGIKVTRETLRDPENNVTIGARFLGFLVDKWDGFLMLVPPSYNAGEGAVTKWLKTRGTWPADEFIEGIAGDQARNYSKRVLGSYFAYTWLYEQEVPAVGNQIPAKLLPKK
jgi:soluble lytic murein transglycosylase